MTSDSKGYCTVYHRQEAFPSKKFMVVLAVFPKFLGHMQQLGLKHEVGSRQEWYTKAKGFRHCRPQLVLFHLRANSRLWTQTVSEAWQWLLILIRIEGVCAGAPPHQTCKTLWNIQYERELKLSYQNRPQLWNVQYERELNKIWWLGHSAATLKSLIDTNVRGRNS